jgi:hypothetical protein
MLILTTRFGPTSKKLKRSLLECYFSCQPDSRICQFGLSYNRDGSVHGLALLRASDRKLVPGWDLLLKPGTQEFNLTAPSEPGQYIVICKLWYKRRSHPHEPESGYPT